MHGRNGYLGDRADALRTVYRASPSPPGVPMTPRRVISPEPIPVGEALGDAPDALIQLIETAWRKTRVVVQRVGRWWKNRANRTKADE